MSNHNQAGRADRWAIVRAKLEAHRSVLAQQGSFSTRWTSAGRHVQVLRFFVVVDGRKIHRTVYLGVDPEIVRRAGLLLSQYREAARGRVRIDRCASLTRLLSRVARRLVTAQRQALAGCPAEVMGETRAEVQDYS